MIGSRSYYLASRVAQARYKKLSVLSIPQEAYIWYHDWCDGPQPLKDRSCIVEPSHMSIASGKKAIPVRESRIFLNCEEKFRQGLIEAPTEKMHGTYYNVRRTD